jgi:antitoxin VapB
MSLNIKDEEAHRVARQLARLTKESMTTAVREALGERLERIRGGGMSKAERILKIGRECAFVCREPYRSVYHGELLYDDKGLPKSLSTHR